MARTAKAIVTGITVLVLALVAIGAAHPAGAVPPDWRQRMLHTVNAVRAAAGVPPVHPCRALQRSAQGYAEQMARTATFGHQGPDGRMPSQRMAAQGYRGDLAGENLAAGQPTVVAVMRQWRASATHNATMTDPRFRHVGFGYARTDRVVYPTYWVQNFGVGGTC